MHDIKAIRDDSTAFVEGLKRRGFADAQQLADKALGFDKDLRTLQTKLQEMQARRNEASKLIGQAKAKKDEAGAKKLLDEVSGLKDEIQKGEEKERELQKALTDLLAGIDNIPAPDVPVGKDEKDNKEVKARAFGKPPSIAKPKDHVDLGAPLGMDFEAAARMSGARFVVLEEATRAARTRHRQFHARFAYEGVRLFRSFAADYGARRSDVRNGTVAEI